VKVHHEVRNENFQSYEHIIHVA